MYGRESLLALSFNSLLVLFAIVHMYYCNCSLPLW